MLQTMELPEISEAIIDECFAEIPIEVDHAFIKAFILNGQRVVREIASEDICKEEAEDTAFHMML